MELRVFIRVIARFKWLFSLGVLLAVAAAFLSTAAVSFSQGKPTVSWRAEEGWSSSSRLLVTAPSIKYGSIGSSSSTVSGSSFESRAPWLATLYATFATSDRVKDLIRTSSPRPRGKYAVAANAISTPSGAVLPIVQITATWDSAEGSRLLADKAAQALMSYVEQQQVVTNVPEGSRVQLVVLNKGGSTMLTAPRSKALPVIALLAVLFATIALVFAVDNLAPVSAIRDEESETEDDSALRVAEPKRVEEIQRLAPRAGDAVR